jgi:hypothetical protein
MPHQVLKASVKGSTGDLAKITARLATVATPTPGQKINILSISAGEVTIPGSGGDPDQEYGVISLILDPDDATTTGNVITALTGFSLGGVRKVEHVDVYPLVHVELEDVPGQLELAANAIGNLNILSVHSMGTVAEIAHVGFAFDANDEATARTNLTQAGFTVR